MNPLKYSEKSRINLCARPVTRGTVSIMLNVKKKAKVFRLNKNHKVSAKSKFKMKWKTI